MDVLNDLKWVIIILVGIWIIWFVNGGARRDEATAGPFIKPAAPLDSGKIYGPTNNNQDQHIQ
jgi:hypothetical protein